MSDIFWAIPVFQDAASLRLEGIDVSFEKKRVAETVVATVENREFFLCRSSDEAIFFQSRRGAIEGQRVRRWLNRHLHLCRRYFPRGISQSRID